MIKRYMAFQIGCLECGEQSEILGLYDDAASAQSECQRASEAHKKDWDGQRDFVVYDLETKEEVDALL